MSLSNYFSLWPLTTTRAVRIWVIEWMGPYITAPRLGKLTQLHLLVIRDVPSSLHQFFEPTAIRQPANQQEANWLAFAPS